MKRWALALALLSGCYGMPPTEAVPPREVETAVQAWVGYGFPYGELCRDTRRLLRKVMADDRMFEQLCQINPERAAGCYVDDAGGGFLDLEDDHGLIVLEEKYDTDDIRERHLDTHELMHWLSGCSGLHPDEQVAHDDPRIWGKGGVLERALLL